MTWERDHWMSAPQQHYKLQWTVFSYVTFKLPPAHTYIYTHCLLPNMESFWHFEVCKLEKVTRQSKKKQGSKIFLIAHTDYHTPWHQTMSCHYGFCYYCGQHYQKPREWTGCPLLESYYCASLQGHSCFAVWIWLQGESFSCTHQQSNNVLVSTCSILSGLLGGKTDS